MSSLNVEFQNRFLAYIKSHYQKTVLLVVVSFVFGLQLLLILVAWMLKNRVVDGNVSIIRPSWLAFYPVIPFWSFVILSSGYLVISLLIFFALLRLSVNKIELGESEKIRSFRGIRNALMRLPLGKKDYLVLAFLILITWLHGVTWSIMILDSIPFFKTLMTWHLALFFVSMVITMSFQLVLLGNGVYKITFLKTAFSIQIFLMLVAMVLTVVSGWEWGIGTTLVITGFLFGGMIDPVKVKFPWRKRISLGNEISLFWEVSTRRYYVLRQWLKVQLMGSVILGLLATIFSALSWRLHVERHVDVFMVMLDERLWFGFLGALLGWWVIPIIAENDWVKRHVNNLRFFLNVGFFAFLGVLFGSFAPIGLLLSLIASFLQAMGAGLSSPTSLVVAGIEQIINGILTFIVILVIGFFLGVVIAIFDAFDESSSDSPGDIVTGGTIFGGVIGGIIGGLIILDGIFNKLIPGLISGTIVIVVTTVEYLVILVIQFLILTVLFAVTASSSALFSSSVSMMTVKTSNYFNEKASDLLGGENVILFRYSTYKIRQDLKERRYSNASQFGVIRSRLSTWMKTELADKKPEIILDWPWIVDFSSIIGDVEDNLKKKGWLTWNDLVNLLMQKFNITVLETPTFLNLVKKMYSRPRFRMITCSDGLFNNQLLEEFLREQIHQRNQPFDLDPFFKDLGITGKEAMQSSLNQYFGHNSKVSELDRVRVKSFKAFTYRLLQQQVDVLSQAMGSFLIEKKRIVLSSVSLSMLARAFQLSLEDIIEIIEGARSSGVISGCVLGNHYSKATLEELDMLRDHLMKQWHELSSLDALDSSALEKMRDLHSFALLFYEFVQACEAQDLQDDIMTIITEMREKLSEG